MTALFIWNSSTMEDAVDLVYIALLVLFFMLSWGLVKLCERL